VEVSLREWLDRPGRAVDADECVHVFRQVAEAVAVAHAQGVALGSARPSCFIVSPPFARVAFIESASGSDASGGSCSGSDDAEGTDPAASPPRAQGGDGAARGEERAGKGFPLRSVLAMELSWYTSPEEADDSGATFASDVYRLGVLLFEVRIAFAFHIEMMLFWGAYCFSLSPAVCTVVLHVRDDGGQDAGNGEPAASCIAATAAAQVAQGSILLPVADAPCARNQT
jgi:serine/threonine protein kinase